ncbi:hypothetical protein BDI4_450007 [Burkholderia diffusa]|nr:hypothetical protein BDI4_450007 [Burkholderia diffusa]
MAPVRSPLSSSSTSHPGGTNPSGPFARLTNCGYTTAGTSQASTQVDATTSQIADNVCRSQHNCLQMKSLIQFPKFQPLKLI